MITRQGLFQFTFQIDKYGSPVSPSYFNLTPFTEWNAKDVGTVFSQSTYDKATTIMLIARSLTKSGDHQKALKLIQQIQSPYQKAIALREIISSLTDKKQIDQVIKMAHQIEEPNHKQFGLGSIAVTLASSGNFDQAIPLAAKLPKTTKGRFQQISYLTEISITLATRLNPKAKNIFGNRKLKKNIHSPRATICKNVNQNNKDIPLTKQRS